MKSVSLLLLAFLVLPTLVSAQVYEEDFDEVDWENQVVQEDGVMPSEVPSEGGFQNQIERQEEPQFPEGESASWGMGSEDLPAEEFE